MDPKKLQEAWDSARRGRLAAGLSPDETWEFAWEVVNEHNHLAAQHGARHARHALQRELLALARADVPIPDAARRLVQYAQGEGLILAEVKPGANGPPRPRGRNAKRSGN